MARTDDVRECSIARTLEIVGSKWTLLAVRELLLGSHRFDEIAQHTGAPRDILTARLRALEEHGLVERRPYCEHPPRHEYHLTQLGQSLAPVVHVLRQWGDDHLAGPAGPPVAFRHSCGEAFHAAVACDACGRPAATADLTQV
ncbi:helix-turn-helix domain-containing protein [Streptomyces sp. CoH27]|uniref:winged helix-turn-helix transcriptional regulator n=1 Tax=Streptomyces sp. CoH27 TaxID=2875763 RepID=UPI001CD1E1B2|nr:helix-turn-helix domain-containing protein [Streptomyces sp. CoH27]